MILLNQKGKYLISENRNKHYFHPFKIPVRCLYWIHNLTVQWRV